MKPWISRLNVMLAATVSSRTFWIDSRLRARSRGTRTRASSPSSSGSTPGREREVVDRRLEAPRECTLRSVACERRDARHLQRRRVLEDPDHLQPQRSAGLRIADRDRDRRRRRRPRWRSPDSWKSGSTREVEVVPVRRDGRVDDREPGARSRARARPARRVVAARDRAEAEGRVLEEALVEAARRRTSRPGGPVRAAAPSPRARTGFRPPRSPGRRSRRVPHAAFMSVIGAVADVPARTWKPPPNSSMFPNAFWNEPDEAVPVTSVKTTSVNIASVAPVRKRALSGYVIAIRMTGASLPNLERTRLTPREDEVGVVDDHPDRADHGHQPGTIQVVKSIEISPKTDSQTLQGRSIGPRSPGRRPCTRARSGTWRGGAIGTRPIRTRQTPSMSGVAAPPAVPLAVSRTPSATASRASASRRNGGAGPAARAGFGSPPRSS